MEKVIHLGHAEEYTRYVQFAEEQSKNYTSLSVEDIRKARERLLSKK